MGSEALEILTDLVDFSTIQDDDAIRKRTVLIDKYHQLLALVSEIGDDLEWMVAHLPMGESMGLHLHPYITDDGMLLGASNSRTTIPEQELAKSARTVEKVSRVLDVVIYVRKRK